jgi:hypothetical protein
MQTGEERLLCCCTGQKEKNVKASLNKEEVKIFENKITYFKNFIKNTLK